MYSYDKALFESMEHFIDVVWHINMKTNEVLILEDKLRKELRGKLLTLDEIKRSAMEPEKNGYIHFIMDILKPENVAEMKESFQIAARIFLDSRYHLLKGNVTPSIDKDGNVSDVYITFIDCQELVDAKDIKEEEVGKAVVSFENQISDTLSGARMGLWKIIFDGDSPKLVMDKTSSELVGAPAGISPEEAFVFLCEHIDVEYVPKLKKYVQNMLDGRPDEIIYPYNHPVLGTITIRCGGRIDKAYSGIGKQLRGYQQDISEQDRKLLLSQQALRVQVENKQRRILIYREISSILAMAKDIDSGINKVLKFLGETLGVSRVFIFEENNDELEDSTFEWCGKGIDFQKEMIQGKLNKIHTYREIFKNNNIFCCSDVSMLNDNLKEMFEEQGIKAALGYAIYDKGKYCGFIGVDDCVITRNEWKEDSDELKMLSFVANLLSMYLIKERNMQKSEQANKAKTTFLNSMSHDIRTPMNAIIGFTSLAASHIDDKKKVADYLEKIQTSSNHLLTLINDVLDMSRIEAGKMNFVETEISLLQIMDNVKDIIQTDINAKNIELCYEIVKVKDENVWCDRIRLEQILLNCVSNAIKFTPDYGKIRFSLIQKSCRKEGYGAYEFKICDTGIGMSQEFLEHIFEPFERERTSTVSGIQGTGLGMSITKNIVDMMGGKIKVNSLKNKGTDISIFLTFKIADSSVSVSSENKLSETQSGLKSLKVLLVEDNELNREIAMEILEEAGVTVFTAVNGLEAVEKVRNSNKGDIDMVLMDIQMPVMDGYEATRQIRGLPEEFAKKVPIIAMTANALAEDKMLALDAGMNAHVAKPINIDELFDNILKVI